MTDFRQDFIRFAAAERALLFGEFVTKAGRVSPYFFNAGEFSSGAALSRLCEFYAKAIDAAGIGYDMLFGEDGNDALLGHQEDDYIDGGDGRDVINGGPGSDTCLAGEVVSSCGAEQQSSTPHGTATLQLR